MPQNQESTDVGDAALRAGSDRTDGGYGKPLVEGPGIVISPTVSSLRNLGVRELVAAFRFMFEY